MNKSVITFLILGLLVGGAIGFWYGSYQTRNSLEAQFQKYFPPIVQKMEFVTGSVKAVNGSVITFDIAGSNNPFDSWPTERTVNITNTTIIIKSSDLVTNKSTFKPTDIKPGMIITVSSAGGKDIKNTVSFDAGLIKVGVGAANPVNIYTPPPAMPAN